MIFVGFGLFLHMQFQRKAIGKFSQLIRQCKLLPVFSFSNEFFILCIQPEYRQQRADVVRDRTRIIIV